MDEKEFRQIISSTVFAAENLITDCYETNIIRKPELDFVIKIAKKSYDFEQTKKGYNLSGNALGGLIAEYSLLHNVVLNVNNNIIKAKECFVQKQGNPLDEVFVDASEDDQIRIVQNLVNNEQEVMGRHRYVFDNFFHNSCLIENKPVLLDLGNVIEDIDAVLESVYDGYFKPDEEFSTEHILNKRGFVIYQGFCELRGRYGNDKVAEAYVDALKLDFDTDLRFDFHYKDIQKYEDVWYKPLTNPTFINPNVVRLLESSKDKSEALLRIILAEDNDSDDTYGHDDISGHIYNIMMRHTHADEFERIAKQEYDKFFKKDVKLIPSKPYIS